MSGPNALPYFAHDVAFLFKARPRIGSEDHLDSWPVIHELQQYFDRLSDALPLEVHEQESAAARKRGAKGRRKATHKAR